MNDFETGLVIGIAVGLVQSMTPRRAAEETVKIMEQYKILKSEREDDQ